jgi:predicted dehydrogenase
LAGAAAELAPLGGPTRAAASDRIGVGIIGCGGQGRANQIDFQKCSAAEVVAVCDVYRPHLERAIYMAGGKATPYHDYRKLLEDRRVQAVVIATPDHWHPLMSVDACLAGKDVYVEKPVSNCIREGRVMLDTARRTGRVVQVGLQQRSGTHFQRAVKLVQEGRLGAVHYVQCWNHEMQEPEGLGNPPDTDPPPELDWDFWLGPAPMVPYNRARFARTFRWFWDYGGGKLADWGTHLIDIVHWAMQSDSPQSVMSCGGKLYLKDGRDTPDTQEVTYQYEGFLLHYSALHHNSFGHDGRPGAKPGGGYGILFHGTLGTLFVDRAGYELMPQMYYHAEAGVPARDDEDDLGGWSAYFTGKSAIERGTRSLQHLPHVLNFLDCIRTRELPIADIEIGYRATIASHLGNIAYRTGEKLVWDAKSETIPNSALASRLLTRAYRPPWKLQGL